MDSSFHRLNYRPFEIEHSYGENLHLLSTPLALSLLNTFSKPETLQPTLNCYLEFLYTQLLDVVINSCFEKTTEKCLTRMNSFHPDQYFEGEVIARKQQVIVAAIARAGTLPAHICFDHLNYLLDPQVIRQDHLYVSRKTDSSGHVVGVDFSGSKIGGGVQDSIVLIPDPMGATGESISFVVKKYKELGDGLAKKYISMHLVVTPEYVKRMQKDHPDLEIFALRLDRGFSSSKALASMPGKYRDEESGLNDKHYIVPGLGGVGEILNNSFV